MSGRGAKMDKSKRGRPPGVLNGFGDPSKKWEPKSWKPLYEVIVSMHVQGYVNKFIADKLQITPQTVSNVINCTAAKGIIEAMKRAIREKTTLETADRVAESVDLIHKRIHGVLKDEDLAGSAPIGVGLFAIKAGQAMGVLKDPSRHGDTGPATSVVNNTQINILGKPEVVNSLVAALAASQKARELNSGVTGESIGVIKNDFVPAVE